MSDLLVTNIGQLITCERDFHSDIAVHADPAFSALGVVHNAAVVAEKGFTTWVGKESALPERFKNYPVLDAQRSVVLPGLVDCHTHAVFGGTRANEYTLRAQGKSYMEIARAGGGIKRSVALTRAASFEELYQSAKERLLRMMRTGSTVIEVKSGYGLDKDTELRQLEVVAALNKDLPIELVPTFLGAHEVPPEYLDHGAKRDDLTESYLEFLIKEVLPEVSRRGLAKFCDVFCETGVFTKEQSRKILMAGKEQGLIPRVHAEELSYAGGSELAAELGAATADHLMEISAEAIAKMVAAGVIFVLLPGTTVFLGKGKFAPAREIIAAGGTIALATDRNPGSCTAESLVLMATLACSNMRITPGEAILAITRNASRALRMERTNGTIAPGKRADYAFFGIKDYQELPYNFGVNLLERLVVSGAVV
jgi:imidazolonepropionase